MPQRWLGSDQELPSWHSTTATCQAAMAQQPQWHRGLSPSQNLSPWHLLVALRMHLMSLLPRDRLIEQLYGEIAALKEELESFKAEVSDNCPVMPCSEHPCGSPGAG